MEDLQRNQTPKSRERPNFWNDGRFNNPSQPVVGLTWFEANAYCAWLGAVSGGAYRLPDEFEWEAAARGSDGRKYAWQGEWNPEKANTVEGRVMRTTPVGSYAAGGGVGPHGEEDQVGNVWEWTASLYLPYGDREAKRIDLESDVKRICRGGSWASDSRDARCAYRDRLGPVNFFNNLGFRPVLSLADSGF